MMTTAHQPYDAWNVEENEFPRHGTLDEKLKFLLNYGVLAPSLHNTQPWKFTVHNGEIRILADRTRHLTVADPDARELYISIGCAIENLLTAAAYFGLNSHVTYFPDPHDEIWVATLSFKDIGGTSSLADQELFHAIALRHTNRQTYANKALNERDVQQLRACLHDSGLKLQLNDDPEIKQQVDSLVISADITQFADPDYRDELNRWITQGEFGYRWLIARVGQLATTYLSSHHKTVKPDADIVLNAPMLALLSTDSDNRLAQVQCGQTFERMALIATTLNIGIQPLSQIIQVAQLRGELSKLFDSAAAYPQMAFRLGYTDVAQDAASRRPVETALKV